jgi:hypothetical protein
LNQRVYEVKHRRCHMPGNILHPKADILYVSF